jgi:hypothetical protein
MQEVTCIFLFILMSDIKKGGNLRKTNCIFPLNLLRKNFQLEVYFGSQLRSFYIVSMHASQYVMYDQ